MPYDHPDPTDPMTLHGMIVETSDDRAMREMTECFVEEYIRLGFDADRILQMFENPGYAGPYLAYQTLGLDAVRLLIDAQMSLRNRPGTTPTSGVGPSQAISLPILDR